MQSTTLVECHCEDCLQDGQRDGDGDIVGRYLTCREERDHRYLDLAKRTVAAANQEDSSQVDPEIVETIVQLSTLTISDEGSRTQSNPSFHLRHAFPSLDGIVESFGRLSIQDVPKIHPRTLFAGDRRHRDHRTQKALLILSHIKAELTSYEGCFDADVAAAELLPIEQRLPVLQKSVEGIHRQVDSISDFRQKLLEELRRWNSRILTWREHFPLPCEDSPLKFDSGKFSSHKIKYPSDIISLQGTTLTGLLMSSTHLLKLQLSLVLLAAS